MNFNDIYHFLFETMPGIAILVGACIVICVIICIFWEIRTRKLFKDRPAGKDEWSMFDDEEDDGDEVSTNDVS